MSWNRFKEYYLTIPALGFSIDVSRIKFPEGYLKEMQGQIGKAYEAMEALEKGAIANPDEDRMVGHYWLRDASLAPSSEITRDIESTLTRIQQFAAKVHSGEVKGTSGDFTNLLIIGIGGSALGPQFVSQALGHPKTAKMNIYFFDNTDPDGMDLTLAKLDGQLGQTLSLVISKSGGTPETRNGMVEAENAYTKAGLKFSEHAVAVTGENSKLDRYASASGWITRFPMWDWVGGRTSELGPVGLLPAALEGLDIQGLLSGAKDMDIATRNKTTAQNPAALLALMWYYATDGTGDKDMVILPYKDRLMLFSKYLQQLVMESLGKEKDLEGKVVHQGIAVYGNKGSTDQHAYVQQLREGVPNFFATFIEVLKERDTEAVSVEGNFTSGDFLEGFLLGTRDALFENDRESITITIDSVTSRSVGMLIALYERAVGYYASLVGINAYHQPGVEAGKKAAATTLDLQNSIVETLTANSGKAYSAEELASELNLEPKTEIIFKLLDHLAANPSKGISKMPNEPFYLSTFSYSA